ncbi:LuxR C-terminal-related transcriptional regulator [Pseudomonas sp. LA21]|uniref:LuxR C-terminal-related transcriptional regulator n=1 Tax=unclassified Pseudomonas TaxID=196821 RepID=UPI001FB6D3FD|nr:LuxR C-terminal-related transcriptional regulator [Pseudomonas sp. LA21]MCJ1887059.1 LuxR C-terminal-related transcriptional regulator [Pseudomonas sp. LA21]
MLSTKFAPPRVSPGAVFREDLLSRLQAAGESRLFLIIGGAGFGKSTLLAQWRQMLVKEGATVAWMSVTPDDGEAETFVPHLAGALRHAGVSIPAEQGGGIDGDPHFLVSPLINALVEWGDEVYLLLDDFHQAETSAVLPVVQALVDNAPTNLHLVLASRRDPPLLLGRWRAMGQLCEIGSDALTFDIAESHAFLKAYLDPAIGKDTAHRLHGQADGWPIGLQLLSLSMKANPRRKDRAVALQPGAPGLAEYLAEDVLAGLPADMLGFLQQLSILRRYNLEVARYITGSEDAERFICLIEERNLFVQLVDIPDEAPWYRFHPMFQEFLYQRLKASSADLAGLHRRASAWFEQVGLLGDAMQHALAMDDLDYLVALLERVQPPQKSVSHLGQFVRWLQRVPLERLERHPALLLLGAWGAVMTVRTAQAEAWLERFETLPEALASRHQVLLLRAALATQRDDGALCVQLLEPIAEEPLNNSFLEQVRASLYVPALSGLGRHAAARRYLNSAAARAARGSTDEMALIGATSTALVALFEGQLLELEQIAFTTLAKAERSHGRRSVSACHCAALLAFAYCEFGRDEAAHEALANRLDILHFSVPEYMIVAALAHARLQPRTVALDYLRQREEYFRERELDRCAANMLAEQVRLLLLDGDWRRAEPLLAALEDLRQAHIATPQHAEVSVLAALSKARLVLVRGQPELAIQVLDSIQGLIRDYARGAWSVAGAILRGLALEHLGRDEEARECLREALLQGYRMGLQRTFHDEGEPLLRLLAKLGTLGQAELDRYLARLVSQAAEDAPPVPEASAERGPLVIDAPMLTPREVEILALLEQSMSNKRIALALNLSLQTVKWNLRNIFAKLGISSRYEAILFARRNGGPR